MDILNILNDYIKENKTDEQLADEFVNLINNGNPIYKIVRQYEYTPEQIKEMIINAGYTTNSNQKWKKTNISIQSESEKNIESSKTIVKSDISNENQNDNGTYKNEHSVIITNEIKMNLNIIVDLLNDGKNLDELGIQYNISGKELHELLLSNDYHYYAFMNFWTRMNKEELSEYIVTELNQGNTLYDLSGKYVKNNNDRVTFITKVEQYLKRYRYKYYLSNKKWSKITPKPSTMESEINKGLPLQVIVNEINKGLPLKVVAEKFNITPINLRHDLKQNNYRFDILFNIWTKDNRSDLVKRLSNDLDDGKVNIEDLKKQNLNLELLEIELKNFGYDYHLSRDEHISNNVKLNNFENKTIVENDINEKDLNPQFEILNTKNITNNYSLESNRDSFRETFSPPELNKLVSSENNEIFNKKEVLSLKEIITHWEQQKAEKVTIQNPMEEINIYIESELLSKLTNTSELEGLSRSKIIEKALKAYFKN